MQPRRSKFVTVTAIVFGLLGAQTAMNLLDVQSEVLFDALSPSAARALRLFALGSGVIGLVVLVSAVGLFLRRRWSRQVFQVAIAAQGIAGLAIPFLANEQFKAMQGGNGQAVAFPGTTLLLAVGFLVAIAWVVWRLGSEPAKREIAL
jgi:hypothetical protein